MRRQDGRSCTVHCREGSAVAIFWAPDVFRRYPFHEHGSYRSDIDRVGPHLRRVQLELTEGNAAALPANRDGRRKVLDR